MAHSSLKNHDTSKKPVMTIALITAICVLGDAMLYIVLPIYWEDFGLTALWQIGVLLSINRFIRLPLNPLVGWFYSRYSKQSGLLAAVMLAVLTTFAYGALHGFWILFVARCLWGTAWSFLRLGGFLTIIDTATDKNRGEFIGTYNGLWGLGLLGGMLIGGGLVDFVGIFPVTSAFSLLALMTIPFVLRYVPVEPAKKGPTSTSPSLAFRHIFRHRHVWSVMTIGFMLAMLFFGVFMSTLSRMIETTHGQTVDLFMFTAGAATLSGLLQALKWGWEPFLAPLVGRLTDRFGNRQLILTVVLILTGILFVLTSVIQQPWIWILIILVVLLFSTVLITLTDALATTTASQYGKVEVMTTYTVVTDVGAAAGPLIAYLVGAWLGFANLYVLLGGLLLIFAVAWSKMERKFLSSSNK